MITIANPFWPHLKQLFLKLVKFESLAFNRTFDDGLQKKDSLAPETEKESSEDAEKINIEIVPELSHPTPKNETGTWVTNKVAGTISPQIFNGFIHGYCPGIRIREFIEPHKAETIAKDIVGFIEEYKTAKKVGRAGITAVEYPNDFGGYAELGSILRDPNSSIPHRLELADKIIMFLVRNTMGFQFKALHYNGTEMFWGLFRELTGGAGWHLDDVTKDMHVFKNREPVFQFSAVGHIQTPKTGGETIIANRRAQKGDGAYLNPFPNDWTYKGEMLDGVWKATVPALTGDLVFLSTLNYHMVNPSFEKGAERISFSMFFVIFKDEPNTIYYYN